MTTVTSIRDLFAAKALADIPKILTLQDRNRHSPTHGCFDRNHWHYKIIDFPCGMSQEFVYPLALVYALDLPDNPWRGQEALRQWVRAGIGFAAASAHADGSCDDYYPFEKALGAAAFTLLAFAESMLLLGLDDDDLLRFVEKRAVWLAQRQESGQLSNHQALVALGLAKSAELLGTERFETAIEDRVGQLLAWRRAEGWFPEYDGCDPGYLTLTIAYLADLDRLRPGLGLREPLRQAIDFVAQLMHPDGTLGGEYCSRNTYNYFPHGFELAGRWHPPALDLNTRFARALRGGLEACHGDDHILGHHVINYLLTWRDFVEQRPEPGPRPQGRLWFAEAGLLVERRSGYELYAGLNKGGAFKLFKDDALAVSDSQLSVVERRGKKARNAVGHMCGDYDLELSDDAISVAGHLSWAKQSLMTTTRLLILRLGMLSVGRLAPDLVRRVLQRLLIVGRRESPHRFRRVFRFADGGWTITDELTCPDWSAVERVAIGCDQTSIYIAMSRTYQQGQLQEWLELIPGQPRPADGQALRLERRL